MIHRQTEYIFPTPLFITKFTDVNFCKDVIAKLDKFTVDDKFAEDKNCWTTQDDLHLRQQFQDLTKKVKTEITHAFDSLGVVRSDEKITCMWANVSKSDNRHALHPHGNSYMSGVLYINAPENCGNLGFRDPRQGNDMIVPDYTSDSIYQNRTIEVKPETGLLVIFPSWLYHGTQPGNFPDNERRISISFNCMPIGRATDFSRKTVWK